MKGRKILGILLLIGGVIVFALSFQMHHQMEMMQMKMSHAEGEMQQPRRLRPLRHQMQEDSNQSLQTGIDRGIQKIALSQELIEWFEIGGVILIVLGILAVRDRKKKR